MHGKSNTETVYAVLLHELCCSPRQTGQCGSQVIIFQTVVHQKEAVKLAISPCKHQLCFKVSGNSNSEQILPQFVKDNNYAIHSL